MQEDLWVNEYKKKNKKNLKTEQRHNANVLKELMSLHKKSQEETNSKNQADRDRRARESQEQLWNICNRLLRDSSEPKACDTSCRRDSRAKSEIVEPKAM